MKPTSPLRVMSLRFDCGPLPPVETGTIVAVDCSQVIQATDVGSDAPNQVVRLPSGHLSREVVKVEGEDFGITTL